MIERSAQEVNPQPQLERLAKVLGLMGSAHDGEALSAARAAERLRLELGLTWGQIVQPRPPAGPPPRPIDPDDLELLALACLDRRDGLTPWELQFCRDILRLLGRGCELTPKQTRLVRRLYAHVRRHPGAPS